MLQMRILMLLSLMFTFSSAEALSDDEYYLFASIANDSYSLSMVGTGEGNKHKLILYSIYPQETKYKYIAEYGTVFPDSDYRDAHTKHQKYEFNKECRATYSKNWIPTSFKCDKNGHTPLAGASYKRVEYGESTRDCEKGEPGFRYICTTGCNNSVAPKYLESDSGFSC